MSKLPAPTLTLLVLAKDEDELGQFNVDAVRRAADELVLLSNPGARFGALGVIGNDLLSRGRGSVVGMLHADVTITEQTVRDLARAAAAGAVAGVVGRSLSGQYVWCHSVNEPTPVSTLDSCCVFIPRLGGLRFDTALFDGFHCCVEDLCLQAAARSKPVLVVPGFAEHRGASAGADEWMKAYWFYRNRLQQKWSHVKFQTT